jgi:hypothetical protein
MLMVSPRDLRREVTSSRIGRMALGGKSETDEVDMLRCGCSSGRNGVLYVVGVRTVILLFKKRDGCIAIPRRRKIVAGDMMTQGDGKEAGI